MISGEIIDDLTSKCFCGLGLEHDDSMDLQDVFSEHYSFKRLIKLITEISPGPWSIWKIDTCVGYTYIRYDTDYRILHFDKVHRKRTVSPTMFIDVMCNRA